MELADQIDRIVTIIRDPMVAIDNANPITHSEDPLLVIIRVRFAYR